jgi:hypothetical protein
MGASPSDKPYVYGTQTPALPFRNSSGSGHCPIMSRNRTCGFSRKKVQAGDGLGSNSLFPSFGALRGDAIDSSDPCAPIYAAIRFYRTDLCVQRGDPCERKELLRPTKAFYRKGRSPIVKFRHWKCYKNKKTAPVSGRSQIRLFA